MATLLRNALRPGVLDKGTLSPQKLTPSRPVDPANKPSSSHKEYATTNRRPEEPTNRSTPRMPPGSWDSHMHIVGDEERYPLSSTAVYRPSAYTVPQAVAFESSIGASNVVIIQPSIYGHDNSCLLDALRILGPSRARAVVALEPGEKTSIAYLREWHELGVRGVRLNIRSTGDLVAREDVEVELRRCAEAVRPLGWVVQLYIPLHMIRALEPIISTLGVRICIDHMGAPGLKPSLPTNLPLDPYSLEGFDSLVRLLEGGNTFIKMSAPYRLSGNDDYIGHVEPIAREILRVAPQKVVFATDWPHTRFEGLDIRPWIVAVNSWCDGDQQLANNIFRDNAKELWA